MLAHKTRPDNTLPTPCSSPAHSVALHALQATTHCWAPRDGSGFGAEANAVGRGPPKNGNAHAGCYGTSAPCMPMVASAPLPDQLPPGARHGHACSNPCHAPRLPNGPSTAHARTPPQTALPQPHLLTPQTTDGAESGKPVSQLSSHSARHAPFLMDLIPSPTSLPLPKQDALRPSCSVTPLTHLTF